MMPYTPTHKARTHTRIVEAAARAFRERGFDGVCISDLMRAAHLTHGGFYAHFRNKDALVAEAASRGLQDSRNEFFEGAAAANPMNPLREIIRRYVSRHHRDTPAEGCAMPALVSEVPHEPAVVRHAFTEGMEQIVAGLSEYTPGATPEQRRDAALALTAGMVGAVALARAVDDPAVSDRILLATRRHFTVAMADTGVETTGASSATPATPNAAPHSN
jgi:TetR/AcrR family transcriptional repressor of nem operon